MKPDDEARFGFERKQMVETQIRARGTCDERLLAAMEKVPRHRFVPTSELSEAYADFPLPIGEGQTISQPYIIALMIEVLRLKAGERVLEIGTGSGYQTALLADMGCKVYTIERIPTLQERARKVLEELGYKDIHYLVGDGTLGWPGETPFDRITVGAAAPKAPPSLVAQLAEGGSMVLPVGGWGGQELVLIEKRAGKVTERSICGCVFVQLIGKEGW